MDMRFGFARLLVTASSAALLVGSIGCDTQVPVDNSAVLPPGLLRLQTLSNRADMISGGDALVEVLLSPDATADGLHATIGDAATPATTRDVSSEFAVRANGRIIGRVTGLNDGINKLTVDIGGKHTAALLITNHKIGGPVFTGAQTTPFVCATPAPSAESGNTPQTFASGLSTTAIDAQCNIATEVKLFYRTTLACDLSKEPDPSVGAPDPAVCFKPYDPDAPAPADLAMAPTDTGVTVPYIIRQERGTLNRGIYDIAVLFDPKADPKAVGWKPYAPQKGWNGKLLYSFGASSGQRRLQIRSEQHWVSEDFALSRGFMVAFNSMTDSLYNSNRTLMTETLMMMKEKIVDNYGEIKYTIGDGCSGGSINQLTAASIFPGLLDGIQPQCTYPDSETTGIEVIDCLQLLHAYSSPEWLALVNTTEALTQAQINTKKAAINGHLDQKGCESWVQAFASIGKPGQYVPFSVDPTTGVLVAGTRAPTNNCLLPESMVYNKTTKPDGIRCGTADNAIAIFGKVTGTTRARATADNVGVQYGLKAVLSGAITPEEFVVLNERVGGLDGDNEFSADRTVGDPDALAIAYRAGLVTDGKHLAKTVIVDGRGYDESGIHHYWRSYSLRARLDAANMGHKNYLMWRWGTTLAIPLAFAPTQQAFLTIDKWVGAMKTNTSATVEAKIIASRPMEAVDYCYLTADVAFGTQVTDAAACDADPKLVPHASPRQVAGGPQVENILKCQLKPFAAADYASSPTAFTPDQLTRLGKVFMTGVCDFSKPGVGQQPAISPLDFSAGPGGIPFTNPPATKGA
jgi:hypothetical protein